MYGEAMIIMVLHQESIDSIIDTKKLCVRSIQRMKTAKMMDVRKENDVSQYLSEKKKLWDYPLQVWKNEV